MAFPVVAATNTSTVTVPSTTHVCNLPASISAGDLLLLFFFSGAGGAHTVSTPADWSALFNDTDSAGQRLVCFFKVASGSEGATVNVTTSAARESRHVSYRMTAYQDSPEAGATATNADANPDPPSLTPSWGSDDTLWIALFGSNDNTTTPTLPTNYANQVSATSSFLILHTCRRSLAAASEDPSTFTCGASSWLASTVAIRPVATAGAQPPNIRTGGVVLTRAKPRMIPSGSF